MVSPPPEGRGRRERLQLCEHREQCTHDGEHLVAGFDADVYVNAKDQHLPPPPLGAIDQGRVALLIGDLLVVPACERVSPRAHEFHAKRVSDGADLRDGAFQVEGGAADGLVHSRDHFDGVE